MIGNFMIFGDSYSTHKEYIPAGYPFYYCTEGRSPEEPVTKMRQSETWWGQMMARTDAKLVLNNSWSGSTVGYTGYHGMDCSTTSSFIFRHRELLREGFFEANSIDTIFVFGGTNDSWSDAPLGEEQYENWQESDLFCVLPAICYFAHTLKQNHPSARLIFIGNCDVKDEVVNCIRNAAASVGAEFVSLHDIDKMSGHPTICGMEQICTQVMEGIHESV